MSATMAAGAQAATESKLLKRDTMLNDLEDLDPGTLNKVNDLVDDDLLSCFLWAAGENAVAHRAGKGRKPRASDTDVPEVNAAPTTAAPKTAAPKQAAPKKVRPAELSDAEVERELKQDGLAVPESKNRTGIWGVYECNTGGFVVRINRTVEEVEGVPAVELKYLGLFKTRMQAALCVARTPEGKAKVAEAAAAAAEGRPYLVGKSGVKKQRWDAGMSGAGQQEERDAEEMRRFGASAQERREAREARREAREARREAKEARDERQRKAEAGRQLALCEALTKAWANRKVAQEVRRLSEANRAQKRERREDAERAIEQAVTEQKDGGRLEEKTRDTLHGFNGVSKALRAKALTLLSRDRAAQILAVTACKRSHVLGVPQLAALGAPPLPRASLPRKAPGGEPKHARRPWLKLPMLPTGAVRGGGKGWRRRGAPRGASPVSSQAVRRPHSVLRPDVLPAHRDYDADTQGVACSRASQSCLRLSQRWPRLCTERRVELGWQDCVRSPC